MTDLPSIIARLEAADGPDREIDAAVVLAFCPDAQISMYVVGDDEPSVFHAQELGIANKSDVPAYTASLDACAALQERVLPGWDWDVTSLSEVWLVDRNNNVYETTAKSTAIAWLIAILRAVMAERESSSLQRAEGSLHVQILTSSHQLPSFCAPAQNDCAAPPRAAGNEGRGVMIIRTIAAAALFSVAIFHALSDKPEAGWLALITLLLLNVLWRLDALSRSPEKADGE